MPRHRSSRLRRAALAAVAALLLVFGAARARAATLEKPAAPAGGAPAFRVLLVGDSWAFFQWQDLSLRTVFAAQGHPEALEWGENTTILGSTAAEWATPAFLQLVTDELDAHPTIDVVQLTMGGNDFLAGMPGGGWFLGMPPEDQQALFDRIAGDVATVIDHVLAHDPALEILLSFYDYPNFVESLTGPLFIFCTANWEDIGEPTPLQLNSVTTELLDEIEGYIGGRPRVHHVRHLGLMQFTFGYPSMGIPPGVLVPPGDLTLPSPPEAMRFAESDCIHLNASGHEALALNLWDGFYEDFFELIFADGFESGDLSAWSGGVP